jgi:hypothetical protein
MKKTTFLFIIFFGIIGIQNSIAQEFNTDTIFNTKVEKMFADCLDTAKSNKHGNKEARQLFEKKKQEIFKKEMNLSEEEAKVFFPVLNQFEGKLRQIAHERKEIVRDFDKRQSTITDAEAKQMNAKIIELQQRECDITAEYQKTFETILSPKKLFLLYKTRDKFMRGLLQNMRKAKSKNAQQPNRDGDHKLPPQNDKI